MISGFCQFPDIRWPAQAILTGPIWPAGWECMGRRAMSSVLSIPGRRFCGAIRKSPPMSSGTSLGSSNGPGQAPQPIIAGCRKIGAPWHCESIRITGFLQAIARCLFGTISSWCLHGERPVEHRLWSGLDPQQYRVCGDEPFSGRSGAARGHLAAGGVALGRCFRESEIRHRCGENAAARFGIDGPLEGGDSAGTRK